LYGEGVIGALASPWWYVATAQAFDEEMRERIAVHRARRDARWRSVEAPVELAEALVAAGDAPVLVDCLTLWLTNLMLGEFDIDAAFAALEAALEVRSATTVLVASEVGLGIVPENALARRFRDAAGVLHQRIAARADRVVLMVAGLPLVVK
jgi:adenosyl cobinamide kinase/adenosyl cobinamide phosphate guanylyltransferase